jgi:hypothetical protein
MGAPTIPEAEFIELITQYGVAETSRRTKRTERSTAQRRVDIEHRRGIQIKPPDKTGRATRLATKEHPGRIELSIDNGEVLIGGDLHLWPGRNPTAWRGFKRFAKERKPAVIVLNGDVLDLPGVSRWPPIGWESHPTVQQEIEYAKDQLHELELAAGHARKIWTLGNHDARFETRLALVAKEYAKISGVHLTDHFPLWEPCWSVFINDDVVVKHRFKSGIHAPHNNTVNSGRTMVTGHLHSAKISPWTDLNGDRYGVDSGCLADPDDRAFLDYTEDGPKNWRSGFCLLTFRDGTLLQPELALVFDENHIQFRGELIEVGDAQAVPLSASASSSRSPPKRKRVRTGRRLRARPVGRGRP